MTMQTHQDHLTELDQKSLFVWCDNVPLFPDHENVKRYGLTGLTKNRSLSYNSKLGLLPCYDLPLGTCADLCLLSHKNFLICYVGNNQQENINPDRKAILSHNLAMIRRPDQFVKTLTYEIKKSNFGFFRFFESGDVENYEQLKAVFKVCNNCEFVNFSLFTKRGDILDQMLTEQTQTRKKIKPENLNIIYSTDRPEIPIHPAEQKKFKILGLSFGEISADEDRTTCEASKTKHCDLCRECFLTPKNQKKNKGKFVFLGHGKNYTARAEKLKNYLAGTGDALQTVQNHAKTQNQTKTSTQTRTTARTARKAQN
jgi:hypothetical protein